MRFVQIPSENSDNFSNRVRYCAQALSLLALLGFTHLVIHNFQPPAAPVFPTRSP